MTRSWNPEDPVDVDLARLARTPRLLVALDFDGTASEHVAEPMSARSLPAVRTQIDRLVALPQTTVAFVSGRSLVDLRQIAEHDDTSPIVLVASHGAQYWFPGEGEVAGGVDAEADALRERLWDEVEPILADYPGVELERKTFGMGIHARRADAETEAAGFAAIDALVAERAPHWRRRPGHHILEFSYRSEGKDAGVQALRERLAPTGILFAGDDVTDEDALRVLGDEDLGVRVGPGQTAAAVRVRNPQEIAALLETLAHERERGRE